MDVSFSMLQEALARFGRPDIFDADRGSQFTSASFTGTLMTPGAPLDERLLNLSYFSPSLKIKLNRNSTY